MIVYKTTNLINGKMYIGMDMNNNPKYFGSGLLIIRAIKKYGIKNFKKEIIEECKNKEQLKQREIYWIEFYDARKSKEYYNIMPGGLGGDWFTNHPDKEKFRERAMGSGNHFYGKTHTEESKKMMSFPGKENYMFNKKHKESSKELQREKSVGRYTLEWFIERHGDKGKEMYEARNKKLSEDRMGDKNPFKGFGYEEHPRLIHVPKEDILKLVNEGLSVPKIADSLGVKASLIRSKIQHYWNCNFSTLKSRIKIISCQPMKSPTTLKFTTDFEQHQKYMHDEMIKVMAIPKETMERMRKRM